MIGRARGAIAYTLLAIGVAYFVALTLPIIIVRNGVRAWRWARARVRGGAV